MLQLFFTISFIAEIIVCVWIISKLQKFDKQVLEMNKQIVEFQPELKQALAKTKTTVNKTMTAFRSLVSVIGNTKGECKKLFSKNFLSALGCLILKIPFKQVLNILDVIFVLKKLLKA